MTAREALVEIDSYASDLNPVAVPINTAKNGRLVGARHGFSDKRETANQDFNLSLNMGVLANRDLDAVVRLGLLLQQEGIGRGTHYMLRVPNP